MRIVQKKDPGNDLNVPHVPPKNLGALLYKQMRAYIRFVPGMLWVASESEECEGTDLLRWAREIQVTHGTKRKQFMTILHHAFTQEVRDTLGRDDMMMRNRCVNDEFAKDLLWSNDNLSGLEDL